VNQAFQNTKDFAVQMDQNDSLAKFRDQFIFPTNAEGEVQVYLCGNSLGLQPKSAKKALENELEDWAKWGVEGHFHGKKPWFHYHKFLTDYTAEIAGAKPHEVVVMNHLTVNLHLLMFSFYRPTFVVNPESGKNEPKRYKIIMEAGAFPSDMYAVQTQVESFGLNYDDAVIELAPREGEYTLRTEDILQAINTAGDSLALSFFSGVQYYTGQLFNMPAITEAAHKVGALAGFDLAHTAGNIDLQLHNWDVDFAAWCSYKYLNSGPGNVSGVYIHEKHGLNPETPRMAGWWGHKEDVRFLMKRGYIPEPGAAGWQMSNAPVFGMAVHLASLEIFHEAKIANLRKKSQSLTSYLEFVLLDVKSHNQHLQFQIITPSNPEERGAQLSILTNEKGKALFDHLFNNNIIADWREPNVIRMAPAPLYNNYQDIYALGKACLNFKP
jgi:kynureninase